ncbi:uncharacterized protein EV422DRAFT_508815 [Fimicolochytrium jonesii]|uniref:uncharacterized protein n=1 Tax=Fimicolochytrium jonesii TaxID=1396493 RepID=UPI0022FE91D7|nr:uncharacterized protein EV422DRAFT_508815 [Fimicolochytrium jonesii]KAI8817746.1 hypothetical protein EV422DRAFT_508815 [Fimicolochytrium jonesii]
MEGWSRVLEYGKRLSPTTPHTPVPDNLSSYHLHPVRRSKCKSPPASSSSAAATASSSVEIILDIMLPLRRGPPPLLPRGRLPKRCRTKSDGPTTTPLSAPSIGNQVLEKLAELEAENQANAARFARLGGSRRERRKGSCEGHLEGSADSPPGEGGRPPQAASTDSIWSQLRRACARYRKRINDVKMRQMEKSDVTGEWTQDPLMQRSHDGQINAGCGTSEKTLDRGVFFDFGPADASQLIVAAKVQIIFVV